MLLDVGHKLVLVIHIVQTAATVNEEMSKL